MNKNTLGIAVLAAGKGTRMKWNGPKALAPLLGKSLIDFVVDASVQFCQEAKLEPKLGIVVGHLKEQLQEHVLKQHGNLSVEFAWQKEQLGTADALKSYFSSNEQLWNCEYTLVVCADTPLLRSQDLMLLWNELNFKSDTFAIAATFKTPSPTGYGRIIRAGNGFLIREEKDSTPEQKLINEVNSGLYIFKTEHLKKYLNTVTSENKSKEFYLTDLFQQNYSVVAKCFDDASAFEGVNSLEQLSNCETTLRKRKIQALQSEGIRIIDPQNFYPEWDVKVSTGTTLYPGVHLIGKTVIGSDVIVEPGVIIKNSTVESNAQILANSYLEEAIIREKASIGPMARIRPGSDIGQKCKVGNFVEIKKSVLSKGSKVSHLSYVGDAEVGENTNIGCGFITCNYDGVRKHKTVIGSNTFIGSDCQAVAPLRIGNDAFIGAGSTINKDVPDGAFAIARSQQSTKEGLAKRFLPPKGDA